MRASLYALLGCALLAAMAGGNGTARAQRNPSTSVVRSIKIGTSTKVLDLGGHGETHLPSGWMNEPFADSSWDAATHVPADIISCAGAQFFNGLHAYWGPNEYDDYAFRQDFTLPRAKGYQGSLLFLGVHGNIPVAMPIYIDGQKIGQDNDVGRLPYGGGGAGTAPPRYLQFSIGASLHPGKNVLAVFAPHSLIMQDGEPCSVFGFSLTLRINGISTSTYPAQDTSALTLATPIDNATVATTRVPFAWSSYHGASSYYLQVWLVHPAAGQTVNASSAGVFSGRVAATRFSLDASSYPRGVYHWRVVAIDATGSAISDWTPEQTFTLR